MMLSDFASFQSLLERRFGLYLGPEQEDSLTAAIRRRQHELRLESARHYLRYLECGDDGRELRRLVAAVANNETYFLRVPEHFDALRRQIIPALVRAGRRTIRIWSAACSTGEEVYSLAMAVRELLPNPDVEFDILGSDISDSALSTARRGFYAPRSLRGLDEPRLARYFNREAGGYQVRPELRSMVRFTYLNLMDHPLPFPPGMIWDVILCRNVLLYFREAQARKVVAELEKVLADDGYLLSAPSESMRDLSPHLVVEHLGETFVHRKGRPDARLPGLRLGRLLPHRPAALPPAAPSAWDTAHAAAASLVKNGDLTPATLAQVEQLCDDYPQQPEAALLFARACLAAGDADRALRIAEMLTENQPLVAAGHFLRGAALAYTGQARAGIEHYQRAIYLDPDFFPAHYHLARCYRSLGDYRRARTAYRSALAVLERVPYQSWQEYAEQYSYEEWAFTCRQSLDAVEAAFNRQVAGLPA